MNNVEYRSTILRIQNVSLSLGGNRILSDVNADIRDIDRPNQVTGQVVALLGPSGIGKTRLFRIIAGLDEPDTGSVLVGEAQVPVRRGMVGVVAQNYPLFPHRTVLGNLKIAGLRSGLNRDLAARKADDWLERFGLRGCGGKYPFQLSGGQRQRAAIAQQFMCSEHFLLMDEPFSGLDPMAVENVCELIGELANAHTLNTIIVVTHDIASAIAVSDTLWLMGRDSNGDGSLIPGAKVRATYNLIERGLTWRRDIAATPEFMDLHREIRERFRLL